MAVSTTFLPSNDTKLLEWSTNFNTKLTATPTAYGMTAAQATTYNASHGSFATALSLASDPTTRTAQNILAKNEAKQALRALAGSYGRMIVANVAVTNPQKLALGLTPRAVPTPIPPPSAAPGLDIISVSGWTARIKLHDSAAGSRRGKPVGVSGASVFSFVGAVPPNDMASWKFEGNTGRTRVDIVFDSSTAPGTKVWLSAFWFNGRKQSGPASAPVSTNLQGGSVAMAA
jgi:hypothetical protein